MSDTEESWERRKSRRYQEWGYVIGFLLQFGAIIWFVASLSSSLTALTILVDKIGTTQEKISERVNANTTDIAIIKVTNATKVK